MALTEAQKLKIARIVRTDINDIDYQITLLGDDATATWETAVVAEIARWDAGISTNFVKVHPNDRNFGADIDPEREKNDIRANLGSLFQRKDWLTGNSGKMVRG